MLLSNIFSFAGVFRSNMVFVGSFRPLSSTLARTLRARANGLRIAIRYIDRRVAPANKRMQRTSAAASKLAFASTANPQPVMHKQTRDI